MSYLKRHEIPQLPLNDKGIFYLDSKNFIHCGNTGYRYIANSNNFIYLKDEDIFGALYLKSKASLNDATGLITTPSDIYILDETMLMNPYKNNLYITIPFRNNEINNRYTISTSTLKSGEVTYQINPEEEV